ncbi:ABC transporter permease [Neobacillus niacini]|uniref:ABC transporter permease n=1 Tax=Neobacillus niacini TaxID=86668 RepID=UPI0021CB7CE6|nr:ABC transporter permease [Neobacillus niacini]MCM3764759.1 ABC transporter permease [Neobacillus niacini]
MTYIIRRFILLFVTLIFISVITFLVFQILPGDPVRTILGPEAEEVQVETLRRQMGLDKPAHVQYLNLVQGFFQGDMGDSIRFSRPVTSLIMERLPITISLAMFSLIIVIFVAIPLGIFTARRENKWSDFLLSSFTQLGMAIPTFFVGMMLILFIGMTFSFFSTGGYVPWSESVAGAIGSLALPALTIALPQIAISFRYARNAILEQSKLDYVRTARGKGLTEAVVVYKHVLKNSMIPVLTVFGLILAEVIAGTIVVEQVFSLPGIGRLLITAVSYRDFPVVQGIVLYIAFVVVLINFIVDILYTVLDPRIRLKE